MVGWTAFILASQLLLKLCMHVEAQALSEYYSNLLHFLSTCFYYYYYHVAFSILAAALVGGCERVLSLFFLGATNISAQKTNTVYTVYIFYCIFFKP